MIIQSLFPHSSIASYVSNIVVMDVAAINGDWVIPLVARGRPSIAFQVTGKGQVAGMNTIPESLVLYGQNRQPFEFRATGHLTIIAYFLHPHILKPFFGFGANEVADTSIDLDLLPPAKAINLKEQLVNASSMSTRLSLLNKYVLKLAGLIRGDVNDGMLFATKTIQRSNGSIALKNIQKELRLTERTFQRRFEMHVGISPKAFSRICQFQPAFQQLSSGRFTRLSDIAYENGYSDQSHFIRVFKEFTNLSPTEYLRRTAEFLR
jgi:AraC-like DNA-binding protein